MALSIYSDWNDPKTVREFLRIMIDPTGLASVLIVYDVNDFEITLKNGHSLYKIICHDDAALDASYRTIVDVPVFSVTAEHSCNSGVTEPHEFASGISLVNAVLRVIENVQDRTRSELRSHVYAMLDPDGECPPEKMPSGREGLSRRLRKAVE